MRRSVSILIDLARQNWIEEDNLLYLFTFILVDQEDKRMHTLLLRLARDNVGIYWKVQDNLDRLLFTPSGVKIVGNLKLTNQLNKFLDSNQDEKKQAS